MFGKVDYVWEVCPKSKFDDNRIGGASWEYST